MARSGFATRLQQKYSSSAPSNQNGRPGAGAYRTHSRAANRPKGTAIVAPLPLQTSSLKKEHGGQDINIILVNRQGDKGWGSSLPPSTPVPASLLGPTPAGATSNAISEPTTVTPPSIAPDGHAKSNYRQCSPPPMGEGYANIGGTVHKPRQRVVHGVNTYANEKDSRQDSLRSDTFHLPPQQSERDAALEAVRAREEADARARLRVESKEGGEGAVRCRDSEAQETEIDDQTSGEASLAATAMVPPVLKGRRCCRENGDRQVRDCAAVQIKRKDGKEEVCPSIGTSHARASHTSQPKYANDETRRYKQQQQILQAVAEARESRASRRKDKKRPTDTRRDKKSGLLAIRKEVDKGNEVLGRAERQCERGPRTNGVLFRRLSDGTLINADLPKVESDNGVSQTKSKPMRGERKKKKDRRSTFTSADESSKDKSSTTKKAPHRSKKGKKQAAVGADKK